MPCLKGVHGFHGHTVPQPMMPMELAVRMCLSHSPSASQWLEGSSSSASASGQPLVSILTPTRQCKGRALAQRSSSADCSSARKKRVAFADSKGLSLTAVCFFTDKEDVQCLEPATRLFEWAEPAETAAALCCTRGPQEMCRVRLGFPLPSADFQAFRMQLQDCLVALESCSVTERALSGTVRVRNVSYEKDVRLRITFNSWSSHHDVPCAYLCQGYGSSDTDAFAFDVPLPELLDPQERFEFCVSYRPGGYSAPLWDNNKGQNYCIHISSGAVEPGAKLCSGPSQPTGLWDSQVCVGTPGPHHPVLHHSSSCPDIILAKSWGVLESTFWL